MQTLRTGCNKVEPKIFAPPQTPFPGSQDGQNLFSWRWSLPLPTNPVWWGSMHTISSYRGNRPSHTNTQTGPITIHCAAASAQCNKSKEQQWLTDSKCATGGIWPKPCCPVLLTQLSHQTGNCTTLKSFVIHNLQQTKHSLVHCGLEPDRFKTERKVNE